MASGARPAPRGSALREKSIDGIAEREYARQDGTTWSEFSVRYVDRSGKRVRAVFLSRKEALEFKAALAYARRHELPLPSAPHDIGLAASSAASALTEPAPGTTLRDFVVSDYWPNYAREELARTTLKGYENAWRNHIAPFLGDELLESIGPRVINGWLRQRRADGVGADALLKARTLLSGIFSYAVEEEVLQINPVRQLRGRRSKRSRDPQKRKRVVRPPGPRVIEGIRASLRARDRVIGATLVSLLAYAGARPGEALALLWTDIFEQTILIEDGSDDGQPKEIKNGIAYRSVELVEPLKEDLNELREYLGVPRDSPTSVFPNAHGEHWSDDEYKRWRVRHYKPAAIAAGLERARPYDLRHAFVSLRIKEGRLSVDEIARQAGHTVETMFRVYRHEIDEYRGRAMPSMTDAIREARVALSLASTSQPDAL